MMVFQTAVRTLARRPLWGFVLAGIVALCTGVSTALFALVDARVLRPLPFERPQELLLIDGGCPGEDRVECFAAAPSIARLAHFSVGEAELDAGVDSRRVVAASVSGDFFAVLGGPPLAGRWLVPEDERAGASVAVVSESFAHNHFGGPRDAIGRSVRLDGRPSYEVVGVAPARVGFPVGVEAWVPRIWLPLVGWTISVFGPNEEAAPGAISGGLVARRVTNASRAQVEAEVRTLHARHVARAVGPTIYPEPRVWRLDRRLVGDVQSGVWLLGVAVGFVLLIGGVNVASLAVALTVGRGADLAVRAALGAPARALAGQAVVPLALLVGAGAAGGVLLAWWGIAFLDQVIVWGARTRAVALHPVTVAGAALTSGLFGVAAALAALAVVRRQALYRVLMAGHAALSGRLAPFTTVLLALQVAVAIPLAASAGAALGGLRALAAAPTGIEDPARLIVADVVDRREGDSLVAALPAIEERLRALPSVRGVGTVDALPFTAGSNWSLWVGVAERGEAARTRAVSDGALAVLGIRLLSGRGFAPGDRGVVIVSRTVARALWGGVDGALDRTMDHGGGPHSQRRVVGVVADLAHATSAPQAGMRGWDVYVPIDDWWPLTRMASMARSTGPAPGAAEVEAAIEAVAPGVRVDRAGTYADELWRQNRRERALANLLTGLAGLVVVLAGLGVHGVSLYVTTLRQQEIGVRMLVGARLRHVVGLVVWAQLRGALAGTAAGLAGTWVLGRGGAWWFSSYGLEPNLAFGALAALGVAGVVTLAAATGAASIASRTRPADLTRSGQ